MPNYDTDDAWIQYFASYAGLDGGNPNAPVWICGIEHGGSIADMASAPHAQPDLTAYRAHMESELYAEDGDSFKLNLFPLPSPSVTSSAWGAAYRSHGRLGNKAAYYEHCRKVRCPTLRELRHRYRPRVIVGTGKTFRDDFAAAFGFEGEPRQIDISSPNGATRTLSRYSDQGTLLYVTPFFGGRYGLNSNALLVELARTIETGEKRCSSG